ncbi:hypothetical protein KUCAC02_008419, partial [Chaenocephalus aceratus]
HGELSDGNEPKAYVICCYLTSALGWLLLEGDRTGGKEAKAGPSECVLCTRR